MTLHARLFGSALLLCSLIQPLQVSAQIISPVNAGQNSGNNAFGTAPTSVGTPNFTVGQITLEISGLTLEADGTIVTTTESLSAVQTAIATTLDQREANILTPLVTASGEAATIDPQIQDFSNQLAESGLNPTTATELITSLVGLANQTSLNQLATAINLFNQIVSTANPELRTALSQNSVFVAISTTLRSARSALGS